MLIFWSEVPYPISLLFLCSCWGDCLQKAEISVISNPFGMKFGTIVPWVNTDQLTESDFGYDVILSTLQLWCHFTKPLSTHVMSLARCMHFGTLSIIHSYLFFISNTPLLHISYSLPSSLSLSVIAGLKQNFLRTISHHRLQEPFTAACVHYENIQYMIFRLVCFLF